MHLFESWFCKPKLNIEVHPKTDFDTCAQKKSAFSIYLACESEANADHEPFVHATHIFGETKPSILYPAQLDGRHLFLIAPTQSEPKKLSLDAGGKAHAANHFGAMLAHALLTFPAAQSLDVEFYVTLSERMKHLVEGEQHEFMLGILQRSVSHKIKKKCSDKISCERTVLLRSELFSDDALYRARTMSKAMSVTRTLINMPANILNPQSYEDCVRFLTESSHSAVSSRGSAVSSRGSTAGSSPQILMEVLDNQQLKNLGCGLICAVGQGSAVPPRIVKLSYHPTEEDKKAWISQSSRGMIDDASKHIALVGKGITFDSGGYNLKPANNMRAMKKDMGGSAAVLGIFLACVQLKFPVHLTCYLALAENMVSGNAMRPGDIYQAHNGLHVEIDNTDAEGRLVLADALSLAVEEKPDWIIDLATLTGAARTALGPLVDSAFGNRHEFNQLFNQTSLETGDWVWNLPLPAQYDSYFDSRVADIMNSTTTPYAGAITAALFLQKFVGSCAWNHIDTFMWCDKAQGMWGEDNAPTAKCVRLVVRAIEDYCLREFT